MKFFYILSLFFITISFNTISGDAQHAGCSSNSAPKRSALTRFTGEETVELKSGYSITVRAIDKILRDIYGLNQRGFIEKQTNPDDRQLTYKALIQDFRCFIEEHLEPYTAYVKRLGESVPKGCVPTTLRLLRNDTGNQLERLEKISSLIRENDALEVYKFINEERLYFINKIDKDPVDELPLDIIQKIYDLLSSCTPIGAQKERFSRLIYDLKVRILSNDFYDEDADFYPEDAPFLASIDHEKLSENKLRKLKTCFEDFLKKYGPFKADDLNIITIKIKIKDIDQLIKKAEFDQHPCGRELLELFQNLDMNDENIEYFSDSNKDEISKKIKFFIKRMTSCHQGYSDILQIKKKMLESKIELLERSVDCKYNVKGILEDLNCYLKKIDAKLEEHKHIIKEVNGDQDNPEQINRCDSNKMLQEALAISVSPIIRTKSLRAIFARMKQLDFKINNINYIIKPILDSDNASLIDAVSIIENLELILQDNPKLSDATISNLKKHAATWKEIADEIENACRNCYAADKFGIRQYQRMAFRQYNFSYTQEMEETKTRLRNFVERINKDF